MPEREPQRNYQETNVGNSVAIEAARVLIRSVDRDQQGNVLAYPDGPVSKLSERHWRMVRTPSFKKWFGDWQDEESEHSSVVDENGEPMLVTHEVSNDTEVNSDNYFEAISADNHYERGLYFATRKGISGAYSGESKTTLLCFLDIRHAFRFEDEHGEALLPQIYDEVHARQVGVMYLGQDQSLTYDRYTEVVVFRAEQVLVVDKVSGAKSISK